MADATDALRRIQNLFGIQSDGVSGQTKRALIEEGVIESPLQAAPLVPVEAAPMMQAGPQPSQELLDRVKQTQDRNSAASFKRIMEQRARQYGMTP